MILWTIQNPAVCEQLNRTGTIHADGRRIYALMKPAYRWLTDEMRKRIGPPPGKIRYPMWAWYQWEGKRHRPDMRSFNQPRPAVLITFDAPDSSVLLSDFDTWHFVLNNWLLERDYMQQATQDEKTASWANIFDLTEGYLNPEDRFESRSIQAVTWEIRKEWIKKIEKY